MAGLTSTMAGAHAGGETLRPADYRPAAAWWTVAVLMLLNAVSLVDRHIVSLLVVDIRADLHLTDFQISLIQGLAFALFYGICGLAFGALIDRYPKRVIVHACVTIWSLAATATGLARSYYEILAARMAVGVGEGGVNPASQSLIASLFPSGKVSLPMSLFAASGTIGMALSYLIGGVLLDRVSVTPFPGLEGLAPWRQVLILTGLPGIAIAFLAFTLTERRPARPKAAQAAPGAASWRDFGALLVQQRSLYLRLLLGYGLTSLITYSVLTWSPTYGRRVLGMTATEIGAALGSIALVGGVLSMAFFGWIIDRQFSRGRYDFALRVYLASALATLPLTIIGFLLNRADLFLLAMLMIKCVLCACYGPGMAIMQIITPPSMRGRVAALMLFTISVFGYAAGPMLAGALTDFVFRDPARVGTSIAVIAIVLGPVATWCLWSSRRLLKEKITALEQSARNSGHRSFS